MDKRKNEYLDSQRIYIKKFKELRQNDGKSIFTYQG